LYTSYANPTVGVNGPVTYAGGAGVIAGGPIGGGVVAAQPAYAVGPAYSSAGVVPAIGGLAYENFGVELANAYNGGNVYAAQPGVAVVKGHGYAQAPVAYAQKVKGGYY
jgi:hypothetical protein